LKRSLDGCRNCEASELALEGEAFPNGLDRIPRRPFGEILRGQLMRSRATRARKVGANDDRAATASVGMGRPLLYEWGNLRRCG
jgi:hypothetical protein